MRRIMESLAVASDRACLRDGISAANVLIWNCVPLVILLHISRSDVLVVLPRPTSKCSETMGDIRASGISDCTPGACVRVLSSAGILHSTWKRLRLWPINQSLPGSGPETTVILGLIRPGS